MLFRVAAAVDEKCTHARLGGVFRQREAQLDENGTVWYTCRAESYLCILRFVSAWASEIDSVWRWSVRKYGVRFAGRRRGGGEGKGSSV